MSNREPKNFILARSFSLEAEAIMAEELLKNEKIPALRKSATGTGALRLYHGNAVVPAEEWGVYVPAHSLLPAQQLLVSVFGQRGERTENSARRLAKPLTWLYLLIFAAGVMYMVYSMIRYS